MPRPRLQRAATARREKVQLRIREQSFREVFGYGLVECMGAVYSRGTESYVRGYRESALGASMCT